ncbi:MAG: class I SAM-dependent methyltransferase [Polaromonas sp.]|nr:class I SAM-dependent methyltransferase [Polaromonas sp.]
MRAYYARRAPYYDAVYERPERQADLAWMRQRLEHQMADQRVLEVACGTGYWTQFAAPVSASMVATDATPEPLALARLRPNCSRAEFVLADAYFLPPNLGRFTAAFAGLWLSHVPIGRRPAFLTSVVALLEPGARVVLFDNSTVQCRDFPVVESDAEGNTFQQRVLRDGSSHRVLKNFPDEAALMAMIDGVGVRPRYQMLENFWWFEYTVT